MSEMTLHDVSMQPLNAFNLIEQLKAEVKRLDRWHDYFAWEREYKKLEAKNKQLRAELNEQRLARIDAIELVSKYNIEIDKSKEALNEAYSTTAALEQALKEIKP